MIPTDLLYALNVYDDIKNLDVNNIINRFKENFQTFSNKKDINRIPSFIIQFIQHHPQYVRILPSQMVQKYLVNNKLHLKLHNLNDTFIGAYGHKNNSRRKKIKLYVRCSHDQDKVEFMEIPTLGSQGFVEYDFSRKDGFFHKSLLDT